VKISWNGGADAHSNGRAAVGRNRRMAEGKLRTRAEDFSEWYNQLVLKAQLADYAPVRELRTSPWELWCG